MLATWLHAYQADAASEESETVPVASVSVGVDRDLLAEFFQDPSRVREERFGAYRIEFLIAILPHPVSIYADEFDQLLSSLRAGLELEGYSFDRFWFPWKKPKASEEDTLPSAPESNPGTLLFRMEKTGDSRLLMLYVVPENPYSGIDKPAFEAALSQMKGYLSNAETEEPVHVRVLGPTYSGTVASLEVAINQWLTAHSAADAERAAGLRNSAQTGPGTLASAWRFHIVSGTASSPQNREILYRLRERFERQCVRYRSMAEDDASNSKNLQSFLEDRYSIAPREIIWLVETSLYGQTYNDVPGIVIPFPMHIRFARSAYARARKKEKESLLNGPPMLELLLGDPESYANSPVPFDPNLSSVRAELVLKNILASVSKKRMRAVVIIATNTKDKLFLSKIIHHHARNVRVVTTEPDLLLAHPEYRQYCRGMLVASSYPPTTYLKPRTMASDSGDPEAGANPSEQVRTKAASAYTLYQFPSDRARGVFEATLTLVAGAERSRFGTYTRASGRHGRINPDLKGFWVSLVGEGQIWPIYFKNLRPLDDRQNARLATHFPQTEGWDFLFFMISLIICVGTLLLLRFFSNPKITRRSNYLRLRVMIAQSRWLKFIVSLLLPALIAMILLNYAWVSMPLIEFESLPGRLVASSMTGSQILYNVIFLFSWTFLIYGSIVWVIKVGQPLFVTEPEVKKTKEREGTLARLFHQTGWHWSFTLFLVLVLGAGLLIGVLWFFRYTEQRFSPFYSFRMISITSGVSPLVPVAFFYSILLSWIALTVYRIYRAVVYDPPPEVIGARADDPLNRTFLQVKKSLDPKNFVYLFRGQWFYPLYIFILLLVVPLIYVFLYFKGVTFTFLSSAEGVRYDFFISLFFDLCVGLILISYCRFRFGWKYLRIYLRKLSKIEGAHAQFYRAVVDNDAYKQELWLFDLLSSGQRQVPNSESGAAEATASGERGPEPFVATAKFIHEALKERVFELCTLTFSLVALLVAIQVYPFEPSHLLSLYTGILVLFFVAAMAFVVVQMGRDSVLSWIVQTRERKLGWDRSFLLMFVLFIVVPLLSLLVSQFPELQDLFLSWLGPFLKQAF